jgi:MerC mercury resistance protein
MSTSNTPRSLSQHVAPHKADGVAVGLSALCLVHCLALPAMTVGLPALGAIPHAHWMHAMMFSLALPISAWAFYRGYVRHIRLLPILLGVAGLVMLALGVITHGTGRAETGFTVFGTLLLICAHGLNIRREKTR